MGIATRSARKKAAAVETPSATAKLSTKREMTATRSARKKAAAVETPSATAKLNTKREMTATRSARKKADVAVMSVMTMQSWSTESVFAMKDLKVTGSNASRNKLSRMICADEVIWK